MKKINMIMTTCAISVLLGTVSVQAYTGNYNNNGNNNSWNTNNWNSGQMNESGYVNFGDLTNRTQSFSFSENAASGGTGACMVKNLTTGKVFIIIPHDKTYVLTPNKPDTSFRIPHSGIFYAKYTLKQATPFSVLNPLNVVKPMFGGGGNGNQSSTGISLMCRTF